MRMLASFAVVCVLGAVAMAQPAGSGSATGSAAVDPAAGSAAPTPSPPPAPTAAIDDRRKMCTDAMNADPSFRDKIVEVANENTAKEHRRAAAAIAKNERHVVLAYASMWVISALFVLFLWRRQQLLKSEIAMLRRDLDAATKDGK